MKYLLLKTSLIVFISLTISCSDDENSTNELNDAEISFAVLTTVEDNTDLAISPETFKVLPRESINLILEIGDEKGAVLVERIDVYLEFQDQTNVDDQGHPTGENNIEEQFYNSIPASEFIQGNTLPRIDFKITIEELYSFFEIDENYYDFTDKFITRFEVVMNDGRIFTNTNANEETIPGYNPSTSPFQYTTNLFCRVDQAFTGEYRITSNTPGVLGHVVWGLGYPVNIVIGENQTSRSFEVEYLPEVSLGMPPTTFKFNLICGSIVIQELQDTGFTCGGPGLFYSSAPNGEMSTYNNETLDDSVLELTFTDNALGDCGDEPKNVIIVMTKE